MKWLRLHISKCRTGISRLFSRNGADSHFHRSPGALALLWSPSESSVAIPFPFARLVIEKPYCICALFVTSGIEHRFLCWIPSVHSCGSAYFVLSMFNILIQYFHWRSVNQVPGGAFGAWMDPGGEVWLEETWEVTWNRGAGAGSTQTLALETPPRAAVLNGQIYLGEHRLSYSRSQYGWRQYKVFLKVVLTKPGRA